MGSFFTLARCSSNRCQRGAAAFLEEANAGREKLLHHREPLTKWPWSLCPRGAPVEPNDALMGYCHGVVNQPLSLRAQTLNVEPYLPAKCKFEWKRDSKLRGKCVFYFFLVCTKQLIQSFLQRFMKVYSLCCNCLT